jgi:enamine deaminase RidA (YjgF/YER057c/UK114 family)
MPRQFISPPDVGPTFGRYNKGLRAGNRIFLSGQVPWDADGNVVGAGDFNVQTAQVMRNTGRVLEEGGGSFSDIAMTRVFTTSVTFRDVIGDARSRSDMTNSTSTLTQVESLVDPYFMLEISGIAHVGGTREAVSPDSVHPTRWPYVHGVRVDDTLYISGQIAVDPQGNLVGRGDAEAQADQAAQNLVRVLEAAGGSPNDLVYKGVYVTNPGYIEATRTANRKYGLTGCPSTLLVIPSLANADYLVEIEAIAVIGTEKTVIRPGDVHQVSGRYEHAIVAADTIYCAGQVSADLDGNVVGRGDAEAQATRLYENMSRVLQAAGASLSDVVSTTTFMTNLQHRQAVNQVRAQYGVTDATNTSVVISALALPNYLIEVEAIAVVGG